MAITEDIRLCAIALTFAGRIGPVTARKLVTHFEDPRNIFQESKRSLVKQGILSVSAAESLFTKEIFEKAEKEIAFAQKYSVEVIYLHDETYPYRLRNCPDAPLVLYKKGNASLNPLKSVGVVGTRKATSYGRKQTEELIFGLRGESVQIVSGLAFGIDTVAHKAALDNELDTIAVLGTGLNMIYPAENRPLAKSICNDGALITEFTTQLPPEKENFPRRNRIIAGISDAVIVSESGLRGGALITAELGISYNRDVFALPGRIGDPYSEGCNWLIKTNKAGLITSVEDLYYSMNWELPGKKKVGSQRRLVLNEDEETIVRILRDHAECSIDLICNSTGFSFSQTAALLLNLEITGMVRSLPGKMYRLI